MPQRVFLEFSKGIGAALTLSTLCEGWQSCLFEEWMGWWAFKIAMFRCGCFAPGHPRIPPTRLVLKIIVSPLFACLFPLVFVCSRVRAPACFTFVCGLSQEQGISDRSLMHAARRLAPKIDQEVNNMCRSFYNEPEYRSLWKLMVPQTQVMGQRFD